MKDPRPAALALMQQHEISVDELWLRYWANGGNAGRIELEAYFHGLLDLGETDLTILSWSVDELTDL